MKEIQPCLDLCGCGDESPGQALGLGITRNSVQLSFLSLHGTAVLKTISSNSAKIFLSSIYRTCMVSHNKRSDAVAPECFSFLYFKAVLEIHPETMGSHEKLLTNMSLFLPQELHHIYLFPLLVGLASPNSHEAQALPSLQKVHQRIHSFNTCRNAKINPAY